MSKAHDIATVFMALFAILVIIAFEMHLRDLMPWAGIVGAIGAVGVLGTSVVCLIEVAKPTNGDSN